MQQGWVPKPDRAPSVAWTGNLRILISMPKLTRPLSSNCLWIPKWFCTGSWQNLPVKRNIQPFWSKHFTALIVDLTEIYMPWYVCKLTNIIDLAFLVNHLACCKYIWLSEMAWFSFNAFPDFLHWSVKTLFYYLAIFGCFGCFYCTKSFSYSFIQNWYGKF